MCCLLRAPLGERQDRVQSQSPGAAKPAPSLGSAVRLAVGCPWQTTLLPAPVLTTVDGRTADGFHCPRGSACRRSPHFSGTRRPGGRPAKPPPPQCCEGGVQPSEPKASGQPGRVQLVRWVNSLVRLAFPSSMPT